MADEDRHSPPRKRARLDGDSSPRRRENDDEASATTPPAQTLPILPPYQSLSQPHLHASLLPFTLSDHDRAALFFRTFLARLTPPVFHQTRADDAQAYHEHNAEERVVHSVAHAVVSSVDGDAHMNDDAPQATVSVSQERTPTQETEAHGGDDTQQPACAADETNGDQHSEAAATEDANTDDEDLQQLSMVMCDSVLHGDAQAYLPSEVSYEDVQHLIFHSAREQKVLLIDKLFKLIKKTSNGEDTIARLVNAEDEGGLTLLMIGVRHELMDLCELVVNEGADVNKGNDKRPVPLLIAAQKGNEVATRFLLTRGANDESKNMALIPAAHFGHLAVVQLLLEFGADQNFSNRKGTTPLMRAAQEGRDEVVRFLIEKGAVACAANNEGMTALMLAAQRGHANIATILIQAGSDVNTQTRQGSTALLLAAKRGHTEAVEALLTAGADIFLKDDRHKTAAETAHRRGHVDLFLKITVSNQLRLMREGLRRERYSELMRLSHLYVMSRATLVPSFKSVERQRLNSLLDRTMKLPRPLLQSIAKFLPMCDVWDRQLKYLAYEAPFQPSKVVQHGIRIIDEILVSVVLDIRSSLQDFRRSDPHYSTQHLTLLRDNASFRRIFTSECAFALYSDAIARLRRMADIQGALACYAAGAAIQFGVEVAQDVVSLVSDMLTWNDARKRAAFEPVAVMDASEETDFVVIKKEELPSI